MYTNRQEIWYISIDSILTYITNSLHLPADIPDDDFERGHIDDGSQDLDGSSKLKVNDISKLKQSYILKIKTWKAEREKHHC